MRALPAFMVAFLAILESVGEQLVPSVENAIWPVLLPVIIGGILAIVGGAVGPAISHLLPHRSSLRADRTSRFEALLASMYAFDHWLDLTKNAIAFGAEADLGPPPISQTVSIASLYFPNLLDSVRAVEIASVSYKSWMSQAGQRRLSGETLKINDGLEEAYRPYLRALNGFFDAATKYASDRNGKV